MKTRKDLQGSTPESVMAIVLNDLNCAADRLVSLLKECELPPDIAQALAHFEYLLGETKIQVALPLLEKASDAENAENLRLAAENLRAEKAIFEWERIL